MLMKYLRGLFLVIALASHILSSAQSESDSIQSVGLVLSGGGAKGIAHIGVIQALEDNGIPIDYITGTSMGAIVGGLYAAGYTPKEMLNMILSKGFSYWSTGKIDPELVVYFNKEESTPAMIRIPVSPKDSSAMSLLPTSLISPLPMNFAFMDMFAAYTAQCGGDFDKLFVPYRSVCSDMTAKKKHVWRSGDFSNAIRTSMSFPIVFYPLTIDGHVMYDGGIFDNFPVDVMRSDFDPSVMIGVDVSSGNSESGNGMVDQLENLIMRHSDYSLPEDEGIKIRIHLNEFGLLDFPKANEIYTIGYNQAMSMMDSIKSRIHTRRTPEVVTLRRDMWKAATPYVRFAREDVHVDGGDPDQNEFIKYLFTSNLRQQADTFGIDHARESYYRAISSGKLSNLLPHAYMNDSTGLFRLDLKATMKNNFKCGVGGYVSSTTSNYLFLSLGYSTFSFRSASANLNAWIGQSYMAGDLNATLRLATDLPSAIGMQFVASRQKYYENEYLFYEDKVPTFIINSEVFTRFNFSVAAGKHAKASAGLGAGYLYDRFYRNNTVADYELGRDRTHYYLLQGRLSYDFNTLDNESAPMNGRRYEAIGLAVAGSSKYNPAGPDFKSSTSHLQWLQLELKTQNYGSSDHWGIGVETDIMLSTRKLMNTYNASLVEAPAFVPSPNTYNSFNPALRANSFFGLSVIPFWKLNSTFSVRLTLSGFLPFRKIKEIPGTDLARYGRWFSDPSFFGELSAGYAFPFATLRGYVNYLSFPARNWNCGISLGLFFLAPKFLR